MRREGISRCAALNGWNFPQSAACNSVKARVEYRVNYGELSDEDLMYCYARGDERAFETIVSRYSQRLFRFARRFLGDAQMAEDVVQEAFLRVHLHAGRYKYGVARFSTWIYRIAWNVCASYLEKKGRSLELTPYMEQEGEEGEPRLVISDKDVRIDQFEKRQFIEELFNSLPASQRMVMTLYYFQEQTYEEISDVTSWPMGTVKATLHRAKTRLRPAAFEEMIFNEVGVEV